MEPARQLPEQRPRFEASLAPYTQALILSSHKTWRHSCYILLQVTIAMAGVWEGGECIRRTNLAHQRAQVPNLSFLESSTLALISMSPAFFVFLTTLFGFAMSIKPSTPLVLSRCNCKCGGKRKGGTEEKGKEEREGKGERVRQSASMIRSL